MWRIKIVDIIYTKWNLANRFSDCIELNESLKEDKRLHDAILKHELGHKNENTFKQDLVHDLTPVNELTQKDILKFMIKHPRTLTQLLPIYWSKKRKQLIYDLNMILIWAFIIFMIGLLVIFV